MKLYAAYGSNMNLGQMKLRCPDSYVVGYGIIEDYELEFRVHANIAHSPNQAVPVVVWSISDKDELELDRYESFPHYYKKETIKVQLNRVNNKVDSIDDDVLINGVFTMVYIMNTESRPIKAPDLYYYNTVLDGYRQNDIEIRPLAVAAIKCNAKFVEYSEK